MKPNQLSQKNPKGTGAIRSKPPDAALADETGLCKVVRLKFWLFAKAGEV